MKPLEISTDSPDDRKNGRGGWGEWYRTICGEQTTILWGRRIAYAISFLLLLASIIFFVTYLKSPNWVETQGTLVASCQANYRSSIIPSGSGTTTPSLSPLYVVYTTANGVKQCVSYPSSSASHTTTSIGPSSVTVYYDPAHPQNISTTNEKELALILFLLLFGIATVKFLLAYYFNWWCCGTFYYTLGNAFLHFGFFGPVLYGFILVGLIGFLMYRIVLEAR